MIKILIYPSEIENESLGNLAKSLIDSGIYYFRVRITTLEFEMEKENVWEFKERINNVLPEGSFKLSNTDFPS